MATTTMMTRYRVEFSASGVTPPVKVAQCVFLAVTLVVATAWAPYARAAVAAAQSRGRAARARELAWLSLLVLGTALYQATQCNAMQCNVMQCNAM